MEDKYRKLTSSKEQGIKEPKEEEAEASHKYGTRSKGAMSYK
jgi:hypothetical protein